MTQMTNPKFEALLDHLKRVRGFDFSGYKRSTLMRRVLKRMSTVGIEDFADYIDHLEVHPQELASLFDTVLINVTAFFRDQEAWDYLAREIVPKIIENNKGGHIRIWSAGCASGQEAYSMAILLCEALGARAFHDQVKIYATDIDESALLQARMATYSAKDLEKLPQGFIDKYFTTAGSNYVFRSDLRRSVIFGRHDLVQDAPISKLDLLVCRNTLMYLNAETQARILARFHFALKDDGFLFLGKAEMLLSHTNLFSQVELQYRVFSKISKVSLRDRLLVMAHAGDMESIGFLNKHIKLRDHGFEVAMTPQVVVDAAGILVLANEQARRTFGILPKDIGMLFRDLEISYRPTELRAACEEAVAERRTVHLTKVMRALDGDIQYLDITIAPLFQNGDTMLGTSIVFADISKFQKLSDSLQAVHSDLETTNEELQSTNEELETTNEELQSTNEELETTNEELQSTNEELETTNEELHSSNEELEQLNGELIALTKEAQRSNIWLQSILSSLRSAMIVLDSDMNVVVWNNRAEDLWGLRHDELVGKPLLEQDLGLPLDELGAKLFNFHVSDSKLIELTVDAINRRGRKFACHIRVTPLTEDGDKRNGLVLLMSEQR